MDSINRKPADGLKANGTAYRVLVIDDSAVMRKMIIQILKSEAYEVCGEGGDGMEASRLYQELHPDLVTLDVNMPNLDGIAALKLILEFDAEARVLMLTSESQKETVLQAVSLGAKNFIIKPPERQKVLEKVKHSLI